MPTTSLHLIKRPCPPNPSALAHASSEPVHNPSTHSLEPSPATLALDPPAPSHQLTASSDRGLSAEPSSKEHSQQLPEECIQAIFEYLANDISTLHSLILSSRTFFRIAVPLLYASPFTLLELKKSVSSQERTKRHALLVYLLLGSASTYPFATGSRIGRDEAVSIQGSTLDLGKGQRPISVRRHLDGGIKSQEPKYLWSVLPPVCDQFKTQNERLQSPSVDYLALYRHHCLQLNLSNTFSVLFPNIKLHSLPPPLSVRHPQTTLFNKRDSKDHRADNQTVTMRTRYEIEEVFLLHKPDRVRVLSLQTQRIPTIFPTLMLFTVIVRFELHGIGWKYDLGHAINFLERHSELYGTIQEIKLTGPRDVRSLKKPSVEGLLQAINSPRSIDLSGYREATKDVAKYKLRATDALEQLLFDQEYIPPSRPTGTLPASLFPTQVESTTSIDGGLNETPSQSTAVFNPSAGAGVGQWPEVGFPQVSAAAQHPLGPLVQYSPLDDDKDDIAMTRLIQQCPKLHHLQVGIRNADVFSWAVERYNNSILFHDSSADGTSQAQQSMASHGLRTLHLASDHTTVIKKLLEDALYAFRDTIEDVKGLAMKLSTIPVISNTDQETFRATPSPPSSPVSLSSSESWELSSEESMRGDVAVMSFGWTWPLSQLRSLTLQGELVLIFDFKSLENCPRLSDLSLTLWPYSPPRTNHLDGIATFAPMLKRLALKGRWMLTERFLRDLTFKLCQLEEVTLKGCQRNLVTGMQLRATFEQMLNRGDVERDSKVAITGLKVLNISLDPEIDEEMKDLSEMYSSKVFLL